MAASRSLGAFAGAQLPPVTAPVAVPPSGPQSSFQEVLSRLAAPSPMPAPMPAMPPRTGVGQPMPGQPGQAMPGRIAPRMPQDRPERPGLAALAQHMAKPHKQSPPSAALAAPATAFIPGVPGKPIGPRGPEVVRDHPEKIASVLAELRAQNPGRKIKAPVFVETWNAKHPNLWLNLSRGRTALARATAAEERQQLAQMQQYLLSGAKKALGSA